MEWKTFAQEKPNLERMCVVYVPITEEYYFLNSCMDLADMLAHPESDTFIWVQLPGVPRFKMCACDDC